MNPPIFGIRLTLLFVALAFARIQGSAITFTNDTAIGVYDTNYDGADIIVTNCVVTVDGWHSFGSLRLLSGAVLTHSFSADSYLTNQIPVGVNLNISNDVFVAEGARIEANGIGYGGTNGPGAGSPSAGASYGGSGAGHGGYGGMTFDSSASVGLCYDQDLQPVNPGSGGGAGLGGPGGVGGGVIRLTVGGLFEISGTVSANGADATNSRSGGGAGGSIWLGASVFKGNGSISADGGAGEPTLGGGGGGGRIALNCMSNQLTGLIHSYGGIGFEDGGAGTIYVETADTPDGLLSIDNGVRSGAATELASEGSPDLLVAGNAVVRSASGQILRNLLVRSNCWLIPPINSMLVSLTVSNNATLERGSGIDLHGRGYPYGQGPGLGSFSGTNGGGGGHAGFGGVGGPVNTGGPGGPGQGGTFYGSILQPFVPGSGGGGNTIYPGGYGGGAIKLSVTGSLVMDGILAVDGESPSAPGAGGGSGGSVWIDAGNLSGSGRISASGGSAIPPLGGGGSGGQVALYCDANQFSGTLTAFGGSGFGSGAAGTIYTKLGADANAQVVLDNGGRPGSNTVLASLGVIDLIVQNGAAASGWTSFHDLIIGPGGRLIPATSSPAIATLTVEGDAMIEAGGSLSLSGLGWPSSQGSGAGRYNAGNPSSGSGAGHGGFGGNGAAGTQYASGGNTYGSVSSPAAPGSGGGGSLATLNTAGGAGGGSLRLIVTGGLRVDGQLTVDGMSATGSGAGGGSGGSLWVNVGKFSGSGMISANGGLGDLPNGGGGGGGQIAIYYASNDFSGALSARGGAGFGVGGAGSVFLKSAMDTHAQVTLDNGGLVGTNTILSGMMPVDLALLGGAVTKNLRTFPVRNLLVGSNSWLSTASLTENWTITGNATIEKGGRISVDGMGYNYNQPGSETGRYATGTGGGGGGHGGFGGNGAAGVTSAGGRAAPDYPQAPYPGGGGGISYYTSLPDGVGGGGLGLSVLGLLTVNGRLSSDGNSSYQGGDGGGAGGGLSLSLGGLAGSGVISATGGSGDFPNGGGGGGGCISVTYQSNLFGGTMSAKGGGGFTAGGAGIIYLRQSNKSGGQLLVNNEGQRGTNTLLLVPAGKDDLVVTNGATLSFLFGSGLQNIGSIVLETNTVMFLTNQTLNVSGSAIIRQGAAIVADGTGYGPISGPGAGGSAGPVRGGGSHGGLGGASHARHYGLLAAPTNLGSGGGNGSGNSSMPFGGAGGGAVWMSVNGNLVVDGAISANGLPGAVNSGGGSGGSVWLSAGNLSGSGSISARGGAGNGKAGGGGGGRVSLTCATNSFNGAVVAGGGGGYAPGGAGTVYLKTDADPVGQVLVDNGGLAGTNTPLSLPGPLDLTISGGAIVHPVSGGLILNSLVVGESSSLTMPPASTNLDVAVLHDATVQPYGEISVNGKGSLLSQGLGAGLTASGYGSGGGYGGSGGASGTMPGGVAYGSAQTPTDAGSGGGAGSVATPGGSEGGGAIRLSVAGALLVEGTISANGNVGLQDNSGGGSGGSIWITSGLVGGSGQLLAQGGGGELFGGGGGGGGRVAVYKLTNHFQGLISASGGPGFSSGATGSVYGATFGGNLLVVAQTPVGVVSNAVSQVILSFNSPVDPESFSAQDVQLTTPNGPMPSTNMTVSPFNSTTYQVSFAQQTAVGDYFITVGPSIQDLFGFGMSQAYNGAFTVSLPTIQGTISDTNGLPIPGVLLQSDGPISNAATDPNGIYVVGAPPNTTFSITPSKTGLYFIPGWRSYANIDSTLMNQDYLAVTSLTGTFTALSQGTNLLLGCYGYSGANYQVEVSVDLENWAPSGDWLQGTNGPLQVVVPVGADPAEFFRMRANSDPRF